MDKSFKDIVYEVVGKIPHGQVSTYGTVALMAGHPGAARAVGQVAHFGPSELPWHRVARASGYMASGFVPGGAEGQAKMLKSEGVKIEDLRILNLEDYIWKM